MKKLCLLLLSALIFSGCSLLPANSETPPAPSELMPLTLSDGNGLYQTCSNKDNSAQYLTYISSDTAMQTPICTKKGCLHNDSSCLSRETKNNYLLGYYNDKLIYQDHTDVKLVDGAYTATPIAISDINGENYKIIGSAPYSYHMPDFNLYGDQLIFSTNSNEGRFFNSVNLSTGESKQINTQPILKADNYLGSYKDYYFYFSINSDAADRFSYEIFKINITNGEVSTLCTIDQFIDPTIFNTTDYSFCYYNGKIYSLYSKTPKGTDILSEIDCLTGESVVIDDNIICTSPNGQHLDDNVLNENLIIRATENSSDLPSTNPKTYAYNLSTNTQKGLTLTLKQPTVDDGQQLFIRAVMGDYFLTYYKYILSGNETITDAEGKTIEMPIYSPLTGIIAIDDYLNSVPNFKEVVLDLS